VDVESIAEAGEQEAPEDGAIEGIEHDVAADGGLTEQAEATEPTIEDDAAESGE
jgi:hypothetical protein